MTRRTTHALLLAPLAIAAGFAVLGLAAGDGPSLGAVLTVEVLVGRGLAILGGAAAALAFKRTDYLRPAWLLGAACFALLHASDIAVMPAFAAAFSVASIGAIQGGLTLAANVTWVWGSWRMAHAWREAGLDDDATRGRRRIVFAVALVASALVAGVPLLHDARALLAGDSSALVGVAADLGDTIGLALIAPVLLTAVALRGGMLLWPWALLTASGIGWVLFDGVTGVVAIAGLHGPRVAVAVESLRTLASVYFCCAGLAQRWSLAPLQPDGFEGDRV